MYIERAVRLLAGNPHPAWPGPGHDGKYLVPRPGRLCRLEPRSVSHHRLLPSRNHLTQVGCTREDSKQTVTLISSMPEFLCRPLAV